MRQRPDRSCSREAPGRGAGCVRQIRPPQEVPRQRAHGGGRLKREPVVPAMRPRERLSEWRHGSGPGIVDVSRMSLRHFPDSQSQVEGDQRNRPVTATRVMSQTPLLRFLWADGESRHAAEPEKTLAWSDLPPGIAALSVAPPPHPASAGAALLCPSMLRRRLLSPREDAATFLSANQAMTRRAACLFEHWKGLNSVPPTWMW